MNVLSAKIKLRVDALNNWKNAFSKPLGLGEVGALEQVGAQAGSALDGLAAAPGVDLGVVAREQDRRHVHAAVAGWARVLRILEQAIQRERLALGRLVVAEHAGDEPADGVGHDHRGQLSARQHIIADGQDFIRQFRNACVKAFIMAAKEDQLTAMQWRPFF